MNTWFRGRFEIRIDEKGRLRMPSVLRNTHSKDNQVVITNGQFRGQRCLDLYTLDSWKKLENRIAKLPSLKTEVQIFQRFYLSGAQETVYDGNGRILLTLSARKYANLDTNIVLVGMGEKIEIWSKSSWDRLYESLAGDFEESLHQIAKIESKMEDDD